MESLWALIRVSLRLSLTLSGWFDDDYSSYSAQDEVVSQTRILAIFTLGLTGYSDLVGSQIDPVMLWCADRWFEPLPQLSGLHRRIR